MNGREISMTIEVCSVARPSRHLYFQLFCSFLLKKRSDFDTVAQNPCEKLNYHTFFDGCTLSGSLARLASPPAISWLIPYKMHFFDRSLHSPVLNAHFIHFKPSKLQFYINQKPKIQSEKLIFYC